MIHFLTYHPCKGQSDQSLRVHVTAIRPFSLISNLNRLRRSSSSAKSWYRLRRPLNFSRHSSAGSVPLLFAIFNAPYSLVITCLSFFFDSRNSISFLVSWLTLFRMWSQVSPWGLELVERLLWCWFSSSSMRAWHLCCCSFSSFIPWSTQSL